LADVMRPAVSTAKVYKRLAIRNYKQGMTPSSRLRRLTKERLKETRRQGNDDKEKLYCAVCCVAA